MSNTGLWPWPDPNNHETQMLSTKCRELEAGSKAQAEKIKRLQEALQEVEGWGVNILEPLAGVGILLPGDVEGDND